MAGRMRDPLAAAPRDPPQRHHDIRRDQELGIALLHVAVGVEAFSVLADHDEIEGPEPRRPPRIGAGRPHIGEQVQILPEISGRIDLAARLVLEIEGRGGTQDQALRGPHDVEQFGPHGGAGLFKACMADRMLFEGNAELKALGCGPQHGRCDGRDLRPDPVAGQNDNAHDNSCLSSCSDPSP
jgi:hypothetical protein